MHLSEMGATIELTYFTLEAALFPLLAVELRDASPETPRRFLTASVGMAVL